mmetsp:Transcript_26363/g.68049  ORF Transcript_26363/g.68049 Transcript_26363/m.68049 type:complete len:90 (+) Transcript_26363:1326-1595(+)
MPAHQVGSFRYEKPPLPALNAPVVEPAMRSPLFLMMKLVPMKIEELTASKIPSACSFSIDELPAAVNAPPGSGRAVCVYPGIRLSSMPS